MTRKINMFAIWGAIVILFILVLSGLSGSREKWGLLENVLIEQEQFNQDIVRQLQIQGSLNENVLDFESTLIGQ